METQLSEIYNNPGGVGSYGGVESLYRQAKHIGLRVSRTKVKNFLKGIDAYTLHRPARKKFIRNRIIVKGIDQQWQADLADMQELRKENDGYGYIMTIIDCFSKYAWAITTKTKSAESIVDAFKKLFANTNRRPEKLQTDKGKEFINQHLQELLKTENIKFFVSNSDQKAAIVERFNRTLKTKIWRYFTDKETRRYVDVLQQLVESYNMTKHRTIGVAPSNVTKENEQEIWRRMYRHHYNSENSNNLNVVSKDAPIRLSKFKGVFDKGYLPNWTEEFFKVSSSAKKGKRRVYKVSDNLGELIEGQFYPEEIQEIDTKHHIHKIEKVLRKRKTAQGTELFVKWKGFPSKFNSWVLQQDVQQL